MQAHETRTGRKWLLVLLALGLLGGALLLSWDFRKAAFIRRVEAGLAGARTSEDEARALRPLCDARCREGYACRIAVQFRVFARDGQRVAFTERWRDHARALELQLDRVTVRHRVIDPANLSLLTCE